MSFCFYLLESRDQTDQAGWETFRILSRDDQAIWRYICSSCTVDGAKETVKRTRAQNEEKGRERFEFDLEQQLVKIFTCFSRVFLASSLSPLQTSTPSTPQIHCMRSASSTTTTTTEIQSNSPRSRGSTTVINSPPSTKLNHTLSTNQDDEVTVEDLLYDAQVSVYSPKLSPASSPNPTLHVRHMLTLTRIV